MIGDTSAILYLTFYYRFISKNSYPIFWFGFALNILTFMLAFFIPESPAWLVSMKRYDEARKSLHKIAKWNGAAD